MEDILSLLENGQSNIVVQVSGRDLLEFTDALVQRACESRESLREIQEGRGLSFAVVKVVLCPAFS